MFRGEYSEIYGKLRLSVRNGFSKRSKKMTFIRGLRETLTDYTFI